MIIARPSPNPATPLTRDGVALQKGIVVIPGSTEDNTQLAASVQAELMNLGFMLDPTAFAAACHAPRGWLVSYHDEVVPLLRQRLGANRDYRPFYRNFPAQVMETSDLALFLNAIVHYASDGRWEPPQELAERGIRFENPSFKAIRLATEDEFRDVFTRLVSINQSLTESDKQTVRWFLDNYADLPIPDSIPFKETLCILAAKGRDVPVKTPTDVLRIAVFLSGGDISLPGVPKLAVKEEKPGLLPWYLDAQARARATAREKFKFKKFSRGERRFLLGLLEKTNVDATEMQRQVGRWLRLGEILHVGEFAARFPRSAEAFQKLRNQSKQNRIRTFAARVDLAFAQDWRAGVDLLATRPGEFARRLDWMLRKFEERPVLDAFVGIAPNVSSKVLFELYNHFASRFKAGAPRSIQIKGSRAKMKTLPPLPPMDPDLVQRIGNTIVGVMRSRIGALPQLGTVWIDERLKQVPVPFAMRSVNTAVKTYVRGTRVPLPTHANVIRPFIHWYDAEGIEDLDLSAGLYDTQMKLVSHISFTNLKDLRFGCCHSGDIRHRKGPCAEYVDIDIAQCVANGVHYALIQAHNYDGGPMHTVKDCVFGLMEREHAVANEIFVPKTIANCMALANESSTVIVCVLDLQDRNCIWADVESQHGLPTFERSAGKSADVLNALLHGIEMSVYDLLALHAQARGTLVPDVQNADVRMNWNDFVTDYARVASYMTF